MPPDSLIVIGVPWTSLTINVPKHVVWSIIQTAVSGTLVAWVAFMLARRRFKTERWHERQGEAYGQILKDLRVAARASVDLRTDESEDLNELERRTFSDAEVRVIRRVRNEAYRRLLVTFDENRYLLSRPAQRTLSDMINGIEDPRWADIHSWQALMEGYIREAHERFEEDLLVDVGTEVGMARLLRRLRRWLSRSWSGTKSRAHDLKWQVGRKVEEWKLALTSHLTQDDVRTPPGYNFKTVEKMKQLGYSRGAIQRELRTQLRADPGPPWPPLPERPARKQPPP
jgi:hypothetical protein